MFLLVTPAGGKLWRFKYRIDGREKLLAIGSYPEIGLGEARRRREEARELVAKGKDPSREKQREKTRARLQAADTFKAICDEYCLKRRKDGQKGRAELGRVASLRLAQRAPSALHGGAPDSIARDRLSL